MSLRLLHVFSTFDAGGPQVRTTRLIAGLGPDWKHDILPMDGKTGAVELLPEGATTRVLPPPPGKGTWQVLRHVRSIVSETRPDLVLTYNWGAIEALLAARTRGVRVVHHEDGFLPDEARGFKRRRVWTRRLMLRGVRALIVPSRNLESIAREVWKLPASAVHWIPNGLQLERFPLRDGGASTRAELDIPDTAPVVGFVGHLRGEKNPLRMLEAFARVTDHEAHLVVLGDGPERVALERFLEQADSAPRVHLVGHRSDPRPYYAAMDVFAMSSDTEQMPVAALEAMASGLPVVATDVGDLALMLPGKQRDALVSLQAPDPAAQLARALDGLLADPGRRAELGRVNRQAVEERFSFARMLNAYRERYEAAAGRV